ncbi:MAG TPA: FCD domain-containing protein [Bauldia sp.]|nr:FCD domain-containing protein [Bauldia sp.]
MVDQPSIGLPADAADAQEQLNVRERSEYLGNLIYRQIFEGIKRGTYAPGDRLPTERRLMMQFAAARNTVRKAISRLVEDGLIQRQMGSGTYVATTATMSTNADGRTVSPLDVLEARMAVEPGFADLLVARATEADFERMEEHLERLERARDQRSFREAGYAFHLEIARATRNPLLVRIFELIIEARAQAGWNKLRQLNDSREAQKAQIASNRRVLAALRERDTASARQLMRGHLWAMISDVAGPVGQD